jgi:hypothetical protein
MGYADKPQYEMELHALVTFSLRKHLLVLTVRGDWMGHIASQDVATKERKSLALSQIET